VRITFLKLLLTIFGQNLQLGKTGRIQPFLTSSFASHPRSQQRQAFPAVPSSESPSLAGDFPSPSPGAASVPCRRQSRYVGLSEASSLTVHATRALSAFSCPELTSKRTRAVRVENGSAQPSARFDHYSRVIKFLEYKTRTIPGGKWNPPIDGVAGCFPLVLAPIFVCGG
jgi:hypothetical protein